MVTTLEKVLPDSYYDDEDNAHIYEVPVVLDNPNRLQKKEIKFLRSMYRGVMLINGKARQGKDLFGVSFSALQKYYFGRPILLDFKPKKLFGYYTPFEPRVLVLEISKMAKASSLSRLVDIEEGMTAGQEDVFKDASKDWLTENETKFKNAILYLSELKRYCYNRNPHSRVNKLIGSICDIHGHLDLLIIGTHIDYREIDRFTFLKNVSIWAHCTWSISRLNTTRVVIRRTSFLSEQGSFDVPSEEFVYWVNGAEPREFLGGRRFYDLYNTQNVVNVQPSIGKI